MAHDFWDMNEHVSFVRLCLPHLTFNKLLLPQKVWQAKSKSNLWQVLARKWVYDMWGMVLGKVRRAIAVTVNQTAAEETIAWSTFSMASFGLQPNTPLHNHLSLYLDPL